MGFRKIREFNVAMLGKQAWRLQTENQSLIAKLMQARYYPSGSFRDANIGGNPSFIWRSIFEAKQLIEASSRVKVGNGELINIWLDPWVPASNNALVTTYWLLSVFKLVEVQEIGMVCMIAWNIWPHRNSVVWKGHYQTPPTVVNGASSVLYQWQQAQGKVGSVRPDHSHQEGGLVWQKLAHGWITCNIDAIVSKQRNNSAFNCLIRDEHGSFQAGYGGQIAGIVDPKITEVMAFQEALSWVKKRNQNKDLRSSNVCFVRRSANIAAHLISREASSVPDREE
ncbi:uncharacterized protein LOC141664852 [Apium graveolens]|uniref:uncharacterized protein LOC141664852 n=1 Tax=Apium graveolens TaxID=4045 RepID=UPI003D7BB541